MGTQLEGELPGFLGERLSGHCGLLRAIEEKERDPHHDYAEGLWQNQNGQTTSAFLFENLLLAKNWTWRGTITSKSGPGLSGRPRSWIGTKKCAAWWKPMAA
jgi:hypothetical protein